MKQSRSSNTSSSSNETSTVNMVIDWKNINNRRARHWHNSSITWLLLPASSFCLHRHDDKYNSTETLNVIIFCSLQTRANTIDKHYWRLSRTHLLKKHNIVHVFLCVDKTPKLFDHRRYLCRNKTKGFCLRSGVTQKVTFDVINERNFD
jgi:hypothetical protein